MSTGSLLALGWSTSQPARRPSGSTNAWRDRFPPNYKRRFATPVPTNTTATTSGSTALRSRPRAILRGDRSLITRSPMNMGLPARWSTLPATRYASPGSIRRSTKRRLPKNGSTAGQRATGGRSRTLRNRWIRFGGVSFVPTVITVGSASSEKQRDEGSTATKPCSSSSSNVVVATPSSRYSWDHGAPTVDSWRSVTANSKPRHSRPVNGAVIGPSSPSVAVPRQTTNGPSETVEGSWISLRTSRGTTASARSATQPIARPTSTMTTAIAVIHISRRPDRRATNSYKLSRESTSLTVSITAFIRR